ncbi:MAG TPA: hypothetical protein VGF45_02685, partial [Polyangia bacterium]
MTLLSVAAAPGLSTGCGDPVLPSDYEGPPLAEVSGVVFAWTPTAKLAKFPVLSVEWLRSLDSVDRSLPDPLAGQPLRFVRSSRLDNDWDIGLLRPTEQAQLTFGQVKFSVGKLVYFDDRVKDGRLDWRCAGSGCDVVKAISSEYVVFLESTPACGPRAGQSQRPELTEGFHYYRVEEGFVRELTGKESMSFSITDRIPFDSDP